MRLLYSLVINPLGALKLTVCDSTITLLSYNGRVSNGLVVRRMRSWLAVTVAQSKTLLAVLLIQGPHAEQEVYLQSWKLTCNSIDLWLGEL